MTFWNVQNSNTRIWYVYQGEISIAAAADIGRIDALSPWKAENTATNMNEQEFHKLLVQAKRTDIKLENLCTDSVSLVGDLASNRDWIIRLYTPDPFLGETQSRFALLE